MKISLLPLSILLAAGAIIAAPTTVRADSNQFMIGPSASVFFPTSSKTADVFGKSWGSIGVGFGSANQASTEGSFSPYIDLLYNSHDGNDVFLFPLGVSYKKAFTSGPIGPYYAVQAFALGVDASAPKYNVHSGVNFGEGARAALGLQFAKFAYVEAGYQVTSSVKSFNFSGTELEIGIRF